MEQRRSVTFMSVLLLVAPLVPSGFVSEEPRQSLFHAAQEPAPPRSGECPRVTLHPMTLAHNIDELAGQHVGILNARVVQVFEPRAFLIESPKPYTMNTGFRDGVLVLIHAGTLRLPSEALGGSTLTILGIAHTVLSARVSPEVSWPRTLDPNLIERLHVRAVISATSVQAPDGTELTEPVGRGPGPARGC